MAPAVTVSAGPSQFRSPAVLSPAAAKTREARLEDYDQIAALQARNGLSARPCRAWTAMWLENPAYRQRGSQFPIGWVLEDSRGEIRGYLGNLPLAYSFRGRSIRAATPYSWVVDAPLRFYSMQLQHRFLKQSDVDLVVCTTPNAVAEGVLKAFDFSKVTAGEWNTTGFWITGYRGFSRSALRFASARAPGLLAYPLAAALFAGDALTNGRRAAHWGPQFEVCTGFDSRFEEFWEELSRQNQDRLLAVRSRETLQWHFGPALARKRVWILAACRGERLVAYAIFDRQDHPDLQLRRIRFADFQALRGFEGLLRPALQWMLDQCRRENIHVLENVGCWLDRFQIPGTSPRHRRRLQSWLFYYKTRDRELFRQLQDPKVWAPSSFDGDASL